MLESSKLIELPGKYFEDLYLVLFFTEEKFSSILINGNGAVIPLISEFGELILQSVWII